MTTGVRKSLLDLVWTGPDADAGPIRRTEQVILEVIDSASQRVTIVSYAVYSIAHICGALVRAAGRGVRINVIVETRDKLEGKNEYNTPFGARCRSGGLFDSLLLAEAESWRRSEWQAGKPACQVRGRGRAMAVPLVGQSDRLRVFDQHGAGIAGAGWGLAGRVEKHFDRLIKRGVLAKL